MGQHLPEFSPAMICTALGRRADENRDRPRAAASACDLPRFCTPDGSGWPLRHELHWPSREISVLHFDSAAQFNQRIRGYLEAVDGMRRVARHERKKCEAPASEGMTILSADEALTFNEIGGAFESRQSVLFCEIEH